MLRHLGEERQDEECAKAAQRIREAYDECLRQGETTADLGGTLGTDEFADRIIARLA